MIIFCTYCSKDKLNSKSLLPAIRRYDSQRINKVYNAAKSLGIDFFILSGEYGLIPSEENIRFYDHKLMSNEVEKMVSVVTTQIINKSITQIYYFSNPIDDDLQPYFDLITKSSKETNNKLETIFINLPEKEEKKVIGFREIWYAAIYANQQFSLSNKNNNIFNKLIEEYPNDGMLYYEMAEAMENLEDFDQARLLYIDALIRFPNPKWQGVAIESLKRIENILGFYDSIDYVDERWNYFHLAHSYIYLPHRLRVFVLSAIERFNEEQRIATSEFRICLEIVINTLYQNSIIIKPHLNSNEIITRSSEEKDTTFSDKVECLLKEKILENRMADLIYSVWRTGSNAIHDDQNSFISDKAYWLNFKTFMEILKYVNDKELLRE